MNRQHAMSSCGCRQSLSAKAGTGLLRSRPMSRLLEACVAVVCLLCTLPLSASETDARLEALQRQAAEQKDLPAYVAVCDYLYTIEQHPDLMAAYADSIRQWAESRHDSLAFIDYYSWKAESYLIQGLYDEGFTWKRRALSLATTLRQTAHVVNCCSDLGYYNNQIARYDSARHYLSLGMAHAQGVPALSEHYRTMLTNYASSYLFEGQTDSAFVYAQKAEQRSLADADTAMWIENLNQLGTICRRQKRLDACIRYFEQAINLCEAQHNYQTAAYIYGNIATVYCEWKRPADALQFSEQALAYARQWSTPQRVGTCHINLGVIQLQIEDKKREGIRNLLRAVDILSEAGNKRRLCEAYNHLTLAYTETGQTDSAMIWLQRLDVLSGELQTDVERYRYHQARASLMQSVGRHAEALSSYQVMIGMLRQGYVDSRDYAHYAHYAACLEALHRPAEAYAALRRAYALRDSAFHRDYTEQLSDFSVRYQTQEKELEIIRLKHQESERKAQLAGTRLLFILALLVAVTVLSFLLLTRQRGKIRLARLAQLAEEKERRFLMLQKDTERRLTRKYLDGLETERLRMAGELHDDVCNALLALRMNVQARLDRESAGGHGPSQALTEDMRAQLDVLDHTRQRLRDISHELMPPLFQYATIDEMLSDYVSHLSLPEGLHASYHSTPGVNWARQVPDQVGFECYRIAQEAVGNVLKHASASHLRVSLHLDGRKLTLTVADDGRGFQTTRRTSGVGLRTIRQRAETIGAHLQVSSTPGQGTTIQLFWSLPHEETDAT